MHSSRFIVTFILGALVSTQIWAASPPEFNTTYQLHKFGMNAAEVNISLAKQTDGSLLYTSKTKTKGLVSMFRSDSITEQAILENTATHFRPLKYSYIHKGGKKNRNQSIEFDYANNKARCVTRGKASELDLQKDMHDAFSLQLKIMNDLNQGKSNLDYQVIHKGKVKHYHFENMGSETIETDAGTYSAIKLKRSREDGKRTTYMWLANQLHFLPVQIKHVEKDGTEFSLEIEKVSGPVVDTPATH